MAEEKIKVLIVDDSVVVRAALSKLLARDPAIEIVGVAGDPYEAREKIVQLEPDVLTLDIEMPKMDGLTFLAKLMQHRPMPVVMCSSMTHSGTDLALKATELGAVEVVSKPSSTMTEGLSELGIELVDKIKAASRARVRRFKARAQGLAAKDGRPTGALTGLARVRGIGYARAKVLTPTPQLKRNQHKLIVIGASTGGTEALRVVLERLPRETPPILIVQHMPEYFTLAFSNRMNEACEIDVKEAEDGDDLIPGRALIAPGNRHLMLRRQGPALKANVRSGPLVCRHRPSVEVLFQSAAKLAPGNIVGVILTGMGADGAQGMARMKAAGSFNIAQDEASSVVFGMPKEAIKTGAVDRVLHLEQIAQAILDACCQ